MEFSFVVQPLHFPIITYCHIIKTCQHSQHYKLLTAFIDSYSFKSIEKFINSMYDDLLFSIFSPSIISSREIKKRKKKKKKKKKKKNKERKSKSKNKDMCFSVGSCCRVLFAS